MISLLLTLTVLLFESDQKMFVPVIFVIIVCKVHSIFIVSVLPTAHTDSDTKKKCWPCTNSCVFGHLCFNQLLAVIFLKI